MFLYAVTKNVGRRLASWCSPNNTNPSFFKMFYLFFYYFYSLSQRNTEEALGIMPKRLLTVAYALCNLWFVLLLACFFVEAPHQLCLDAATLLALVNAAFTSFWKFTQCLLWVSVNLIATVDFCNWVFNPGLPSKIILANSVSKIWKREQSILPEFEGSWIDWSRAEK